MSILIISVNTGATRPLIDPEVIDQIISNYKLEQFDYYTNVLNRTFPIGTDVEIFSFEVL